MRTFVGRGVGAQFLDDLLMADKYVYVVSRWISPSYARKLVNIARDGVEVKIITSDDSERHHQEALKILKKALKPPKLAFFMRSSWTPPNMELGIIRQQYLHVKMYVFDDKMAVVGSANFTEHGLWNNIEHIVVFDKPEEVEEIKRDFKKLWRLYTESRETAVEIITLGDIARAIGKTVKQLLTMFAKLRKRK